MEDFKWNFNNFASEMLEVTLNKFTKTDYDYTETEHYLDINSGRLDKILNSLNEEDRAFTKEYIDIIAYKGSCSDKCIYIAGYKDCVKLLRELGVI